MSPPRPLDRRPPSGLSARDPGALLTSVPSVQGLGAEETVLVPEVRPTLEQQPSETGACGCGDPQVCHVAGPVRRPPRPRGALIRAVSEGAGPRPTAWPSAWPRAPGRQGRRPCGSALGGGLGCGSAGARGAAPPVGLSAQAAATPPSTSPPEAVLVDLDFPGAPDAPVSASPVRAAACVRGPGLRPRARSFGRSVGLGGGHGAPPVASRYVLPRKPP